MNNVMCIAGFCAWLGTKIVCIVLIVTGIWRWLAHPGKRAERLDTAAWISAAVLGAMLLSQQRVDVVGMFDRDTSDNLTSVVIYVSKSAVKLLMLGAVVACVLLLLCVVFLFVRYAVSVIWRARPGNSSGKNLAKELGNTSRELSEIMKSPILILIITCGIVGVFVIMPLLMGNISDDASLTSDKVAEESGEVQPMDGDQPTHSLSVIWQDGVIRIAHFGGNDSGKFSNALFTYILIFIIILGMGCAVMQILYSIISDILITKRGNGLIDEYSGSMGIMAVGVSILWTLQKKDVDIFDPKANALKIISEFLKSFGVVLLIIAVGILVLEVIRLLMDMKEEFIRIEARCLFICLGGEAALLLLDVLISLYGAVSSAIGGKGNAALEQIQEKLRNSIIKTMDQQLNGQKNFKRTFFGFKGRPTNKRGGGSSV